MNVSFFGVRGSTPCPGPANARYGGNTACVVVERPGADPLVLDLGTGLRSFGETLPHDGSFRGSAFVTHLHWDHVQGLPFFVPILRAGACIDIYGPQPEDGRSLADAFAGFMRPPYFPVTVEQLPGQITFHELDDATVQVGDARVTARSVPHVGHTNGYRLECDDLAIAYVSDHQQPCDGSMRVVDSVLELCDGVDLLIHDAQYTVDEFTKKCDWGHCTVEYAVNVARTAGAGRLVLFHHDPAHDDEWLDCILVAAERLAGPDLEVVSAYEGLTISLG
ncbi:MAG: MBL fold metallo-hydrolase [Acidimicrobiia bacterium]|nr:MBL fold metallo-hydrolase [Acidimicrobiia bacterium]